MGEELLVRYGAKYWRFYGRPPRKQDRRPVPDVDLLAALSTTSIDATLTEAILDAADRDATYAALLSSPPADTMVHGGLLWDSTGTRLYVPNDPTLRTRILAHCHDDVTGAHFGRDKTLAAVQQRFRWAGLTTAVELYVSTCDACQRNKPSQQLTPGSLMPLPLPDRPCQEWTNDAVTGLPRTKRGHDAIQVYVERLCKLKHFAATRKSDGAKELAACFVHTVVRPHGVPEKVISDRDPRFTAKYYAELTKLMGITLSMSTARHPQSDGQSEREIKTLIIALRAYCNEHQDDWDDYLDMLELGFNSAVQSSTQTSPYELLYGMKPRLPIDVALSTLAPRNPAAIDRATRMRESLKFARDHLLTAQANQSRNASRRPAAFAVGDSVLLKTDGLTLRGFNNKLCSRYVGPFVITAVVNANAYTLALPPQLEALHSTFNIDKLKSYHDGAVFPTRPRQHARPPPVADADSNGDQTWEVERVTAQRYHGSRMQFLVKWKGYPLEESTWQSRADLAGAPDALRDWEG
jgi:Integrase zinc binding domain/Chromo (CHRromatin Organisation MOdifier) domain